MTSLTSYPQNAYAAQEGPAREASQPEAPGCPRTGRARAPGETTGLPSHRLGTPGARSHSSPYAANAPHAFRSFDVDLPMLTDEEWQQIAVLAAGKIAGMTVYTNKNGRKVVYPTSPPTGPPSPKQVQQRERFATAQAAWSALSAFDKTQLELATQALSLPLTGQNLYIRLAMQTNQVKRLTIMRQTGLTLPPIPFVPFTL